MAQGGTKKTIRQLRRERGWLQADVAEHLGVHRSAVSIWERGVYLPEPRTLLRLGDLFGVRVEEIALGPPRSTRTRVPARRGQDRRVVMEDVCQCPA